MNVRHIILGIAIALVSVFFFAYAVQTIYPGPEYDDFCNPELRNIRINTSSECTLVGGQWHGQTKKVIEEPPVTSEGEIPIARPVIVEDENEGWCDVDYTCRQEYDDAREVYERNVFFINLALGIIVLVAAFFLAIEAVSAGLMGGAVLLIFYGTIRYWGNLSDIWRTLVLGISLIILIWLGYKKLKD